MIRNSVAIFCVIFLFGCGGAKAVKKAPESMPAVKVMDSQGPMPAWVESEADAGEFQGKKALLFVGFGESKNRVDASEAGKLNAATSAAIAIKAVASKQVARAWESIGIADNEHKEQVMKGLEAISSKDVDVSGLLVAHVWWRLVSKPLVENGQVKGWSSPLYQYYYQYALDHELYLKKRNAVIEETRNKKPVKKEPEVIDSPEKKIEDIKDEPVVEPEKKEEEKNPKGFRYRANMRNKFSEEE